MSGQQPSSQGVSTDVAAELGRVTRRSDRLVADVARLELAVDDAVNRIEHLERRLDASDRVAMHWAPLAVAATPDVFAPIAEPVPVPTDLLAEDLPDQPAVPHPATLVPDGTAGDWLETWDAAASEPSVPEIAAAVPESSVPENAAATIAVIAAVTHIPPAVPTAVPVPVAAPPTEPRRAPRLTEIERAVSGRGLAWLGGLALVLGAIFFLSLAFSRGWVSPAMRVAAGLAAGAALTAGGSWVLRRRDPLVGRVLVAVGIGVWNLSVFAACRLYGLLDPAAGLTVILVGTAAATALAIRIDAQEIALFSLGAALAAPMLLDAATSTTSVLFVGILLLATTTLAFTKDWAWLPAVALLVTLPQLAAWTLSFAGRFPPQLPGVVAWALITGTWLLHTLSVTAQTLRPRPPDRLSVAGPMAALLVLASLTIPPMALVPVNPGERAAGAHLLLVAALLGAITVATIARLGERNAFARTAGVLGALYLLAAMTLLFPYRAWPVALGVCGVLFTWLHRRTRVGMASWFAAAYLVLGTGVATERWASMGLRSTSARDGWPDLAGEFLVLIGLLAALAAAGWLAGRGTARVVAYLAACVAVVAFLPIPFSGLPLVVAWCVLAVVASAAIHWSALQPEPLPEPTIDVDAVLPPAPVPGPAQRVQPREVATAGLALPVVASTLLAIGQLLRTAYPPATLNLLGTDPVAFAEHPANLLGFLLVLATLAVVGWLATATVARQVVWLLAAATVVAVLPHELAGLPLLAAWSALTVLGTAALRWPGLTAGRLEPPTALIAAPLATAALALGRLLLVDLPPSGLRIAVEPVLHAGADRAALAAALVAAGAAATAAVAPTPRYRTAASAAAIVVVAYLALSVLGAAQVVAVLSALATASLILAGRWDDEPILRLVGGALALLATTALLAVVAPPSRLVVRAANVEPVVPLWEVALATAAWAASLVVAADHAPNARLVRVARIAAACGAVWFLSVAVVGLYQQQVGGTDDVTTLARRAQVSLSVLWALLGGGLVAAGLARFGVEVRLVGLALLGLATVKVFVVDLNSLDVAYRVLSLLVLGALLLASSYAYRHFAAPVSPEPD